MQLTRQDLALKTHRQVFVTLRLQHLGQGAGGIRNARFDGGQDIFLPGQALHLPDPKR